MQNVCIVDVTPRGPARPLPWQDLEAPQEECSRNLIKKFCLVLRLLSVQ